MSKKMMTVLVALAFVCSSFLLVSCAKKQVKVSEEKKPAVEVEEKVEKVEVVEVEKDEDTAAREAQRQARLRELAAAQRLADEIRAFETTNIYFDFDKSDLKPEAQETLKQKAEWLLKHPAYTVRVEGNCDERGTQEYNLALGQRRADAAKKFLMALGVAEHRIGTISYGEERPADPGHNERAWALNRRDEFKLTKRW